MGSGSRTVKCQLLFQCTRIRDAKVFRFRGEPKTVVAEFLSYIEHISREAYKTLREKFGWVFREMVDKRQSDIQQLEQEEENIDPTARTDRNTKVNKHYLTTLMDELERYLKALPVVGLNTGKYDINDMKAFFLPNLLQSQGKLRPIKRNNTYMAIGTEFIFLDLVNYVAPGLSYANVLEAYECQDTKGFFPYKWMDDLTKLDQTRLPPADAFYSKLRGTNISPDDNAYCQRVWQENDMKTMKDFLIWTFLVQQQGRRPHAGSDPEDFYYDFMLKFVDVSDFQYCEMDTDSAYIAISVDKLDDVIKPELRDEYEREKHLWFPRTDSPVNAAFDRRTPGLFKEEWAGHGIGLRTISLNSGYIVLFKSPRDQSMVTTLAKQMFPGHSKFLQECFEDGVNKKTHGHLFLDLHPESPQELRVRSVMLTPQPYVYLRK
ncbi:hypothetical protein Bbelb_110910 [Branchiostoma belcheri]|nr:hypothetical protein Bbelb_110910 [Branchiostoma belcheri]